ncbi:hypothetical protein P3T18_000507 [Paraburkholderia sp. GAS199]
MLTWTKSCLISVVHREYFSADTVFPRRNKRHIIPSIPLRNLKVLDWTFIRANSPLPALKPILTVQNTILQTENIV